MYPRCDDAGEAAEQQHALEEVERIAAVEGVDVLFLG